MMLDAAAMIFAQRATARHVGSARPNAPIRGDRQPRRPRTDAGRERIATTLRRLASRIEPQPVQTCRSAS
jgi:hypothetical protein